MTFYQKKVEMNLIELIDYTWTEEIENQDFTNDQRQTVHFGQHGYFDTCGESISPYAIFTVEKTITLNKDDAIPKCINLYYDEDFKRFECDMYENKTLDYLLNKNESFRIQTILVINDDHTLSQINTTTKPVKNVNENDNIPWLIELYVDHATNGLECTTIKDSNLRELLENKDDDFTIMSFHTINEDFTIAHID